MGTYAGGCFCGSVTMELSGEPIVMGFCHCESCKSWSGSCVQPFALWKPGNVRVTKGVERRSFCCLDATYGAGETSSVGVVQVDVRDFIGPEHFFNC
jgi:hypothetical protein